jgi:spore coat protein CotF
VNQQQVQDVQPQFTFEGGHMVMYRQESTGLPQVKDANVNDRDRMQDLLAQEKYLGVAYNIAMNEAGHEELFQVFKQNHDNIHQLQRNLFNTMFKKGWYKLPVADAQAVAQTVQQFQQYQTQFPFSPGQQFQQAQQAQQQSGIQQQTGAQQQQQPQTGSQNQAEQQLQQQVDRAFQQAEQGSLPTVRSSRRKH